MPSAAATIASARPGRPHRDRVEERRVHDIDASAVATASASAVASAWTRAAMRRRPSGPWYTAYTPAITASSTCAVQMLLVAFSRRMCCSPCLQREPERGAPRVVTDTPTSRPGSVRVFAVRGREERGVRAAEAERHAEPLRRADHDVGAELARRDHEAAGEQVGGDGHETRPPRAPPR